MQVLERHPSLVRKLDFLAGELGRSRHSRREGITQQAVVVPIGSEQQRGRWRWMFGIANGRSATAEKSGSINVVRAYATYDIVSPGSLQLCNLKRHQKLTAHIVNACAYLGMAASSDGLAVSKLCPSTDQIWMVWDAMCQGTSFSRGVKSIGTKGKMTKMVWCIAESMRDLDRSFVKGQKSSSLMRDDADGRMHIRLCSTNSKFDKRLFFLGQAHTSEVGSSAEAKTGNTEAVYRSFATSGNAPLCKKGSQNFFDNELFDHMRNTLHQVSFDSASNEVLSGRLMKTGIDSRVAFAPNICTLNRDRTHGCRRILSRIVAADPYLQDVMGQWAQGQKNFQSVASVIDNNAEIKAKFASFVREAEGHIGTKKSNLGFANHRYESMAKPLGRMIHSISAVVETAMWVICSRPGSQAKTMTTFLSKLDNERYLTAALMADAADEDLSLIRFTEPEDLDVAAVQDRVHVFLRHIRYLFGDEEGCKKTDSYTQFALKFLSSPKTFKVKDRLCTLGCVGGVSASLWRQCIARMRPWLTMAESVVATEFPSFDVLRSFAVFGHISNKNNGTVADRKESFQRLAQTYKAPCSM